MYRRYKNLGDRHHHHHLNHQWSATCIATCWTTTTKPSSSLLLLLMTLLLLTSVTCNTSVSNTTVSNIIDNSNGADKHNQTPQTTLLTTSSSSNNNTLDVIDASRLNNHHQHLSYLKASSSLAPSTIPLYVLNRISTSVATTSSVKSNSRASHQVPLEEDDSKNNTKWPVTIPENDPVYTVSTAATTGDVSRQHRNQSDDVIITSSSATTTTRTASITTVIPAEHETFLLFSSANSIYAWSVDCGPHTKSELLHLSHRPSSIKHGISDIALWRYNVQDKKSAENVPVPVPPPNNHATEVIWFDVDESRFHRALIVRRPVAKCDTLLGVQHIRTLSYNSNPYTNQLNHDADGDGIGSEPEKRVKLAIDNRNQLLFAANTIQNRVDMYRLDRATVANNEIVWLGSLSTAHPYDIVLDDERRTVFWIEDRKRICRLQYRLDDEQFLNWIAQKNRTLLANDIDCTEDLLSVHSDLKQSQQLLTALTLDTATKRILWTDQQGRFFRAPYYFKAVTEAKQVTVKPSELGAIINLAMLDSETLFFSDQHHEVVKYNLHTNQTDSIQIGSNFIFGLAVARDLLPTNATIVDENDDDNDEEEEPITDMPFSAVNTKSNTIDLIASHWFTTRRAIFLLASVSLIGTIAFVMFAILQRRRKRHLRHFTSHNHRSINGTSSKRRMFGKLKFNLPPSYTANSLFTCLRGSGNGGSLFSRSYNKLRQTRAGSTGADHLIVDNFETGNSNFVSQPGVVVVNDSCDIYHGGETTIATTFPSVSLNNGGTDSSSSSGGQWQSQQYRHNLLRQQPFSAIANGGVGGDIEDMFNFGTNPTPTRHCIACRDSDICQDKGICMQTYRVF